MRLQRKADLSLGCLEPGLRPVDNGESATSFFRGKKYNQIFNVAVQHTKVTAKKYMSESMYCVYSSDKNHYCFLKETGLVLQNTELEQSGISKVLLLMGNANK